MKKIIVLLCLCMVCACQSKQAKVEVEKTISTESTSMVENSDKSNENIDLKQIKGKVVLFVDELYKSYPTEGNPKGQDTISTILQASFDFLDDKYVGTLNYKIGKFYEYDSLEELVGFFLEQGGFTYDLINNKVIETFEGFDGKSKLSDDEVNYIITKFKENYKKSLSSSNLTEEELRSYYSYFDISNEMKASSLKELPEVLFRHGYLLESEGVYSNELIIGIFDLNNKTFTLSNNSGANIKVDLTTMIGKTSSGCEYDLNNDSIIKGNCDGFDDAYLTGGSRAEVFSQVSDSSIFK